MKWGVKRFFKGFAGMLPHMLKFGLIAFSYRSILKFFNIQLSFLTGIMIIMILPLLINYILSFFGLEKSNSDLRILIGKRRN